MTPERTRSVASAPTSSAAARIPDISLIGNEIDRPAIDYARLAQAHGVWAEGPISDPKLLNAALAVVKSGRPALVDVVCQAR